MTSTDHRSPRHLIVARLAVERGGRTVVDGLNLTVAGGEIVLLTGPNGAGKTTLLRALAGLLAPANGSILFDGGDAEATLGEQAHYLGHANAIKPNLTVAENVTFWARFLGSTAAQDALQTAAHALERLSLDALSEVPAGYLSAGQRRRLAIARLLAAPRPVWLLDEPSVSLDAHNVAVLAGLIRDHAGAGGITIAATHIPLGLGAARELRLGTAEASA